MAITILKIIAENGDFYLSSTYVDFYFERFYLDE